MSILPRSEALICLKLKTKGPNQRNWQESACFSKVSDTAKIAPDCPKKPDIALRKYKTAIFVNGCFWHKHEGYKYFVWPQNNVNFWRNTILGNAKRDAQSYKGLAPVRLGGGRVLVVWERELKKDMVEYTLERIVHNSQS